MKGKAYGIGVGPGDPDLMTLKAVKLIRENEIIAVPGKRAESSAAYQIAVRAVPELADKELIAIDMPMTKDRAALKKEHISGAALIEHYLDQGKNVVYLTLGDPTIYCSFSYLQQLLEKDGYSVELVSGVPSFCAAAARLGIPLAAWNEPLHIMPSAHRSGHGLELDGNYVLMKAASHIADVKQVLKETDRRIWAVSDCGMRTEKVFSSAEEIPDDASYFTLVIAKER